MLHDFSQAETGWFSPFVTVHFAQVLLAVLQRAKLLHGVGSAVLVSAPTRAPCPLVACLGLALRLVRRKSPWLSAALGLLPWLRVVWWCWWAGVLCPSSVEAGRMTSGKPCCSETLCSSLQRWGTGLQKPLRVNSSDG